MPKSAAAAPESPAERLQLFSKQALEIAKKARKHRQNLGRDNHYGNKMASLRTEATNAYTDLVGQSAGDNSALAELIDAIFSPDTDRHVRVDSARQLDHALKTTWRNSPSPPQPAEDYFFPPSILAETKRGYIVRVGIQMNGSYVAGHMDACAVMLRRLVEIGIIEAYETHGIADKITDGNGNYLMLSALIDVILQETVFKLSRNGKQHLPRLRDVGHLSAHGRHFLARKPDLDRLRDPARIVLEELFTHAKLL